MREAEIKHGRVAMLATIGYTYPEAPWAVQAFPGEAYSHANPIKAAIAVPPGAWANIIFFVGLMEFATNRGKMTMMEMFEDPFFYSVRRTRRAAPARLQALRSPSRCPCAPKTFAHLWERARAPFRAAPTRPLLAGNACRAILAGIRCGAASLLFPSLRFSPVSSPADGPLRGRQERALPDGRAPARTLGYDRYWWHDPWLVRDGLRRLRLDELGGESCPGRRAAAAARRNPLPDTDSGGGVRSAHTPHPGLARARHARESILLGGTYSATSCARRLAALTPSRPAARGRPRRPSSRRPWPRAPGASSSSAR